MDRRELLKRLSIVIGGSMVVPSALLADEGAFSDRLDYSGLSLFSKSQRKTLAELAEIILPRTDVPGAKDAKVVPFIELLYQDCYEKEERDAFLMAMTKWETDVKTAFGKPFLKLSAEKRLEAVAKLEKEAKAERQKRGAETKSDKRSKLKNEPIFWYAIKRMTLWAFFTSEPGMTQAMNYIMAAGPYEGARKIQPGERTFM